MISKSKIIFIIVILILCFSLFSGCILNDFIFGTSFSLSSWKVCDDEGFPCLSINYSCNNLVTIKIFGPDDELIDSDLLFHTNNYALINLASYRGSVDKGFYKLRVYDEDNKQIFEKKISFIGGDLSIFSCYQRWWKKEVWKEDFSLIGLTLDVYNKGDVPVYPDSIVVNFDFNYFSGFVLPSIILPGDSESINCYLYIEEFPGNKFFNLSIKDTFDKTIGRSIFFFEIDDNVLTKKFEWNYKWRNQKLMIPYPDFLFSYYSNIDRIFHEDYSLYIFDNYDEGFIDLIVERLLNELSLDNNIDKINYVASFIQNLNYKSDSKTNKSLEYPRYPIETLENDGGDCEDLAILTASLLNRMNYDVALFRLTNHMAIGVNINENISNYDRFYDDYYFLETTNRHDLGYIPNDYKFDSNLTIYQISSRPILIHKWKNSSISIFRTTQIDDFVKVTLYVENIGNANAENIMVSAGFYTQKDSELNVETKIIPLLRPGMKDKVTIIVDIPIDFTTWFKTRIYYENDIVDQKESASSFP